MLVALEKEKTVNVVDLLIARRKELEAEKLNIDNELKNVATALDAIAGKPAVDASTPSKQPQIQHRMNVDEAIMISVREGKSRSPRAMFDYLGRNLGVHTTIGSIRTRVSKLRRAGLLARDDERGWVLTDPELTIGDRDSAEGLKLLDFESAPSRPN